MQSTLQGLRGRAPALDEAALRTELLEAGIQLADGERPFIDSAELLRRYGVSLPKDLVELWRLADECHLEHAGLAGFEYVRVAPGGWEPPALTDGPAPFWATLQRFEWSTFSNMQFLERLAGLAPLGKDRGDNRFEVATCHPDAPVFWLDHETADLLEAGCVASSLDRFLRVQVGDEAGLSPQELALVRDGSTWRRDEDGFDYLSRRGPLHQWPPFLWARHAWIVAELCFESAREHLTRDEVFAFDFSVEQALVPTHEPLALYWLLRSLVLDDKETLRAATALTADHPSPLVRAFSRFLVQTPKLNPDGLFARAQVRAKASRDALLKQPGRAFDAGQFLDAPRPR